MCDGSSGKYHENLVFHQAYKNGGGKTYPIRAVCIKKAWYPNSQYRYDYSFMIAQSPGDECLSYKLKIPGKDLTAIGYPDNYENTKYMQKVDGKKGSVGGGIAQMLSNPMGNGCSGGAWLQDNVVVGLNSFLYIGFENETYGPYFDESFENLFEFAKINK